jgi:hypothetical protein
LRPVADEGAERTKIGNRGALADRRKREKGTERERERQRGRERERERERGREGYHATKGGS